MTDRIDTYAAAKAETLRLIGPVALLLRGLKDGGFSTERYRAFGYGHRVTIWFFVAGVVIDWPRVRSELDSAACEACFLLNSVVSDYRAASGAHECEATFTWLP